MPPKRRVWSAPPSSRGGPDLSRGQSGRPSRSGRRGRSSTPCWSTGEPRTSAATPSSRRQRHHRSYHRKQVCLWGWPGQSSPGIRNLAGGRQGHQRQVHPGRDGPQPQQQGRQKYVNSTLVSDCKDQMSASFVRLLCRVEAGLQDINWTEVWTELELFIKFFRIVMEIYVEWRMEN